MLSQAYTVSYLFLFVFISHYVLQLVSFSHVTDIVSMVKSLC